MMKENMQVELRAARTMLQRGVPVHPHAPWLLRLFGIRYIRLMLRQPLAGTMERVAGYYLSTGISSDQLDDISTEDALTLMARNGGNIRKAVAAAILNGWVSGWLFVRPMAWYLRWHLDEIKICTYMNILVKYGGVSDFMTTTRYVRSLRLTTPNLGHETKRS